MQVRDVMSSTVVSINVDTPINEAVAAMRMNNISYLPVTHEKVCAGVLTEQDILRRMSAEGFDPTACTAGMLLSQKVHAEDSSRDVQAISQEASLSDALKLMDRHGIRHLAVHDEEYVMVGVVTRAEIEQPLLAETI